MFDAKINLDGTWKLRVLDGKQFESLKKPVRFEKDVKKFPYINGEVPGNFELDLVRAGLLADPFFGDNILTLQSLEFSHLVYYREFTAERAVGGVLRFDGVDTFADIYLNGEYVGSTDNMLIEHEFPAKGLKKGKNGLLVHIRPVYTESRKHPLPANAYALAYNYESLYVRKAPHMFGWDIMPRVLSGGIWKSVTLYYPKQDRIDDVFGYTCSVQENVAELCFHFNVTLSGINPREYTLVVQGKNGESEFFKEQTLWHTSGKISLKVDNPKLWWPKNYGEAELYQTKVRLYRGQTLLDVYSFHMGIRTVELDRTSLTDGQGNGKFRFLINGKPVFVLGTNWVPLDAFHSRDKERLSWVLPMLDDLHCNAVRCWGGNVYESDEFFDYCDEHGIMVWQDFAMACGSYPLEEDFYAMLKKESVAVIKRLRNHPSLTVWSGDNECDYIYTLTGKSKQNPNYNLTTRKVLAETLRAEDFTRPYMPSSPYIDEKAYEELDFKNIDFDLPPQRYISEDHLWGPRDYFKSEYYAGATCHFASEMGYHGCNAVRSIKRFISPNKLWHWKDNDEWLTHSVTIEGKAGGDYSYRIALMAEQVKTLFGFEPETLEEFSLASQISQAEAMKFFVERFRVEKGKKSGIIWWNLIDGWPQFSDAVVDYYGNKKLAYYYIKRSQTPLLMMIGEPQNGVCKIHAVSELQKDVKVKYSLKNVTTGETVLVGEFVAKADESIPVSALNVGDKKEFYLLEWEDERGEKGKNHFVSNAIGLEFKEYVRCMEVCGFETDAAK